MVIPSDSTSEDPSLRRDLLGSNAGTATGRRRAGCRGGSQSLGIAENLLNIIEMQMVLVCVEKYMLYSKSICVCMCSCWLSYIHTIPYIPYIHTYIHTYIPYHTIRYHTIPYIHIYITVHYITFHYIAWHYMHYIHACIHTYLSTYLHT